MFHILDRSDGVIEVSFSWLPYPAISCSQEVRSILDLSQKEEKLEVRSKGLIRVGLVLGNKKAIHGMGENIFKPYM